RLFGQFNENPGPRHKTRSPTLQGCPYSVERSDTNRLILLARKLGTLGTASRAERLGVRTCGGACPRRRVLSCYPSSVASGSPAAEVSVPCAGRNDENTASAATIKLA